MREDIGAGRERVGGGEGREVKLAVAQTRTIWRSEKLMRQRGTIIIIGR